MQPREYQSLVGDMLRIDVETPEGLIVWEIPVRPIPGQPASYLADRINEMLSLLEIRGRYMSAPAPKVHLLEQQTLALWRLAYREAIHRESKLSEMLEKHLLVS